MAKVLFFSAMGYVDMAANGVNFHKTIIDTSVTCLCNNTNIMYKMY